MKYLFFLLFLCNSVVAKADMLITIIGVNRLTPERFDVVMRAESLTPVDTFRASTADRSVDLVYNPGDRLYHGIIDLTGLPEGKHVVTMYAVNRLGDVRTASHTIVYDTPPKIILESPVFGEAYNDKLHIKITVSDVGSTAVEGSITSDAAGSMEIDFTNSLDTVVDMVPRKDYQYFGLTVRARDSALQGASKSIKVFKDNSSGLSKVWEAKTGGILVNIKEQTALLQLHPLILDILLPLPGYKVVDMVTDHEETVQFDKPFGQTYRIFTSAIEGGATFYIYYGFDTDYEYYLELWYKNSLIHLSRDLGVRATGVAQSYRNYLVWPREGGIMCITDLNTMQTSYKGSNVTQFDVTPDGKIMYVMGKDIYLYELATGNEKQITNSHTIRRAIYDKGQIVYTEKRNPALPDSVILYNGVTSVSQGIDSIKFVNYGDSCFFLSLPNPLGRTKLFIRAPGEPDVELEPTTKNLLSPKVIGDDGAGIYNFPGERRYYDRVNVDGMHVAYDNGLMYFRDSSYYLALGNTIYRSSIPVNSYPPKVIGISPDTGVAGQQIRLTGRSLSGITGVSLGGAAAGFEILPGQDSIMIVTVGRGASGDVVIVTPVGTDTLKNAFTFIPGPRIREVSPMKVLKGDEVVIRGTLFNTVTGVSFGGVPAASFTVLNDSTIRATLGSGGHGYVVVSGPMGLDTLKGFVFIYPPVVNSISLNGVRRGTPITIRGSGFTYATAVTFGGMPARSFTVLGDSTIAAVVGRGTTGDVAVTNQAGTGVLPGFVFVGPVILSVTPMRGKNGDEITIRGINLLGFNSLRFNNYPAYSNQFLSDTMMRVVLGSGGTGDVTIASPNGKDTLPGFFYYYKPAITAVSPNTGRSGAVITIRGSHFTDASVVKFGGVVAASFTVVNDSTVTAVVGEGASGEVSVTTPASVARMGGFVFQRDLPEDIYTLKNMNVTCRGVKDGSITVTAIENGSYRAKITGGGRDSTFTFTKSATVGNLGAGTYSLCITVAGQERCFTSVLTQPADLGVMVAVVQQEAVLNLSGSEVYNISLNDSVFSVLSSSVRLPLRDGRNTLSVSTDKYCQGTVYKEFVVNGGMSVYPNPFYRSFSVQLGTVVRKRVLVQVFDGNGKLVLSKVYREQSGLVSVDMPGVASGLYVVKVSGDGETRSFKVLKQ